MDQLPLIDVAPEPIAPELPTLSPPPHTELFLVFAFYRVGRYWDVRGKPSLDRTTAEHEAGKLPSCWTHRCIVRVPVG